MNVNNMIANIFDTHWDMSTCKRSIELIVNGNNEYLRIAYILDNLHISYQRNDAKHCITLADSDEYLTLRFADSYVLMEMKTKAYSYLKFIFLEEIYQVVSYIKMYLNRNYKRAVLFGGCFNPVTAAHYQVMKELSKENETYVIVVPTCDEYLREYKKLAESEIMEAKTRLLALHEATLSDLHIIVDDIEVLEHRGITRTLRTLYNLKDKYKVDELGFSIGSSDLETLHAWWHIEVSLTEFYCYVVSRLGFDGQKYVENDEMLSQYKDHFKYVEYNNEYSEVSSTKIREALRSCNRAYLCDNLPKRVYDFLVKEEVGE